MFTPRGQSSPLGPSLPLGAKRHKGTNAYCKTWISKSPTGEAVPRVRPHSAQVPNVLNVFFSTGVSDNIPSILTTGSSITYKY
jgi:hypothetical protein